MGDWQRVLNASAYHIITKFKKQPPEVFCKKCVNRNFAKFTGKHQCQGLPPATLLKKRLWRRFFFCELLEISKNIFFTEHLWTTASEILNLRLRSIGIKKIIPASTLSANMRVTSFDITWHLIWKTLPLQNIHSLF